MEIIIDKTLLATALKAVNDIAGNNTLTGRNVRFDAGNGKMILTVHGIGGCTFQKKFQILDNMKEPLAFSTDVEKLAGIIPKIKNDTIKMVIGKELLIKSDGVKMELPMYDIGKFPKPERETLNTSIKVKAEEFIDRINSSYHSLNPARAGEMQSAFYFRFSREGFHVVTTDGNRFSLHGKENCKEKELLVPNEAIKKVSKYFKEEITIEWEEGSMIQFYDEDTFLKFNSLAKKYFDVDSLIKNVKSGDKTASVTVKRMELIGAAEMATTMEKDIISLTINNGQFLVSSSGTGGKFVTRVDAEITVSKDFTVNLKGQYLLDALKVMPTEDVTIYFGGELSPLYMEETSIDNVMEVILPIRKSAA